MGTTTTKEKKEGVNEQNAAASTTEIQERGTTTNLPSSMHVGHVQQTSAADSSGPNKSQKKKKSNKKKKKDDIHSRTHASVGKKRQDITDMIPVSSSKQETPAKEGLLSAITSTSPSTKSPRGHNNTKEEGQQKQGIPPLSSFLKQGGGRTYDPQQRPSSSTLSFLPKKALDSSVVSLVSWNVQASHTTMQYGNATKKSVQFNDKTRRKEQKRSFLFSVDHPIFNETERSTACMNTVKQWMGEKRVICLQEFDRTWEETLKTLASTCSYEMTSTPYQCFHQEVLLVLLVPSFFSMTMFDPEESKEIKVHRSVVPLLGAVLQWGQEELLVMTTHIPFMKDGDRRIEFFEQFQKQVLTSFFFRSGSTTSRAVCLLGDFNMQPDQLHEALHRTEQERQKDGLSYQCLFPKTSEKISTFVVSHRSEVSTMNDHVFIGLIDHAILFSPVPTKNSRAPLLLFVPVADELPSIPLGNRAALIQNAKQGWVMKRNVMTFKGQEPLYQTHRLPTRNNLSDHFPLRCSIGKEGSVSSYPFGGEVISRVRRPRSGGSEATRRGGT